MVVEKHKHSLSSMNMLGSNLDLEERKDEEREENKAKKGREMSPYTAYAVLLPLIQALSQSSKSWSNFRAKPPPPQVGRGRFVRRKKRGVCIYCRILFGGGQVRMPASVNTRLTEAAELSRPPRLMYLRRRAS